MARRQGYVAAPGLPEHDGLLTVEKLVRPERQEGSVSEWSLWSDPAWYFSDPARDKYQHCVAVWDFKLRDDSCFLDRRYDEFREASKIVIYCLHRWPAMGSPLKAQTINEVSIGLRYWVRWLCEAGYTSLDQVGPAAMQAFEDYLIADKLNDDLDQALSSSSIARYMRGPFAFWEERSRLEAAGIRQLPELPFPGETPHIVAGRLTKIALGRVQPLPREILIPLMNTAASFMETPSRDVLGMIRFLASEVPTILKTAGDRSLKAALGRYITSKVTFSSVEGKPWHGLLTETVNRIAVKTLQPKQEESIELARDLVHDVMAAASILIQGAAGLRVSEIEMLEADTLDPDTGLPDCIELRHDDTGTIELFYLKGFLVKTTASREPAEWLIGSRVTGSNHLPPPVDAVLRLYQIVSLLDPGRTSRRLFLGTTGSAWNYFVGSCEPLDRTQLQAMQRAFAANYVDRALLDRIELLRTHAWRKSFAQFIFGVDPTLGPALSQHFKHLQVAMTMEAYVTNDPILLGYLESERAMETARDLYEMTTGRQAGAGRLSKSIVQHGQDIAALIAGKDEKEAVEALYGFVSSHQVPFWFLEWGNCGIAYAPSEAACHSEAGTSSWRNIAPDFGYRDLDVCTGCKRLVILRRHLPFWQARLDRLTASVNEMDDDMGAVFQAAVRKKLYQAKAVVRALSGKPASEEDPA